ncbi:transposase [Longispora albida]|uniref:transposase n=1 Tax=Longispora albida TaxID=203523 RepID=UPI003CCC4005
MYCGLATAGDRLGVVVVDDSGRVLAGIEVTDDPAGYGRVVGLLAEHTAAPASVPIAADAETRIIARLFAAAGRLVAFAEPGSVIDSEADHETGGAELLARALQRGALLPTPHPAPRDLAALRPVLAAHSALISGRQASSSALRDVLRELYPAALRAFRDPAGVVPLAVLDSLPEPGLPVRVKPAQLAASLVNEGLAAEATDVEAAIEALRVAVTDSPRKAGLGRSTTAAVAAAVRQAVAAVKAAEAGAAALVEALNDRLEPPGLPSRPQAPRRRAATRAAADTPTTEAQTVVPAAPAVPVVPGPGQPEPQHRPAQQLPPPPPSIVPVFPGTTPPPVPEPIAAQAAPEWTEPVAPAWPPAQKQPAKAAPVTPLPAEPAASGGRTRRNLSGAFAAAGPAASAGRRRGPEPAPAQPAPPAPEPQPEGLAPRVMPMQPPVAREIPDPQPLQALPPLPPAPASLAPQVPIAPSSLTSPPLSGQPGRVAPPWQDDDLPAEPPALRLVDPPPLADRALREPAPPRKPTFTDGSLMPGPEPQLLLGPSGEDPLLAPPPPPADLPALPPLPEERPLRLVGEPQGSRPARRTRAGRQAAETRAVPVPEERGDGDLLIFSAAKSAWFTDPDPDAEFDWGGTADAGWRAAEQASRPQVGGTTGGGLPRRVPQANLVPGSAGPLAVDRPPRPVRRDAAEIAAHTSGYFKGWQRGRGLES